MTTILPLVVAKPVEAKEDFAGLNTPFLFARYVLSLGGVDVEQLRTFQEIYYGSSEPSGADAGKIWVKRDGAPAIGIRIGSQYQMFYQYPPDVPLLWTKTSDTIPSYMRRLTDAELTQYSLIAPVSGGMYVIFETS